MKAAVLLVLFLLAMTAPVEAQDEVWSVFASSGDEASIEAIVRAVGGADVLLVGEMHDDEAGHRFKRALLEEVDRGDRRQVVLSLEMFERDVQLVVDEYLAGLISEQHFRASSRPWPNYERDYRPLLEYAREHGLPVAAANVPRRYVNRVAREGTESVSALFGQARALLPPLPLPAASDRYRELFMARTSAMHGHGGPPPERMFEAQHLWDAGMALTIVEHLDRNPSAVVMHVAGSFHVEQDSGIPDMLRAYRPGIRIVSVVVRPADAFDPEEHGDLGDFIVVTPLAEE